jgi:STE24 endopeptidase
LRTRRLFLLLCLLLACTAPRARASETAAEHAADVYASQEMASHPLHGNLPDYSLPPEKLAEAQHLSTVRSAMHFVETAWGIVSLLVLLSLGAVAWMRDRSVALTRNRWGQGFAFTLLFILILSLLNLPLDIYSEHLSRVYGFSVQSWPSWIGDQFKSLALSWLLGGLLVMLLFWVIRKLPRTWWVVFWVLLLPLTAFGAFIGPYISYVFYAHEPLAKSNPALVQQLQKVVAKAHLDIPPERMYLMKASAKTTTLNADVEGFGASKRLVLWDTTLAKCTPDEITLIFGHESGHYVLHHIERGMLEGFFGSLLVLYLGFRFVQWALGRFGPRWRITSQADWAAIAVLSLAVSLLSVISEPIESALSREKEHAADIYGQELAHGIVADPQSVGQHAFDVLGETSLADPNPSPFYEFWTYSHPAIGRRAAFAHAYNPWAAGFEPKYFPKRSE